MPKVYLSLGSNLGNRVSTLEEAIAKIGECVGRVIQRSDMLETEPWGFESNNRFINMAIEVETPLLPSDLLCKIISIEQSLGRVVKSSNGIYNDRTIDIDILLYDEILFKSNNLTIPHPQMCDREFVLQPLAEIAPNTIHPLTGLSIVELLGRLRSV